ncbi:hypothetical protein L1887_13155 [Cichorium endivia]|nr:hypothetical protein L1887_13155 [Cichorium endivia]
MKDGYNPLSILNRQLSNSIKVVTEAAVVKEVAVDMEEEDVTVDTAVVKVEPVTYPAFIRCFEKAHIIVKTPNSQEVIR